MLEGETHAIKDLAIAVKDIIAVDHARVHITRVGRDCEICAVPGQDGSGDGRSVSKDIVTRVGWLGRHEVGFRFHPRQPAAGKAREGRVRVVHSAIDNAYDDACAISQQGFRVFTANPGDVVSGGLSDRDEKKRSNANGKPQTTSLDPGHNVKELPCIRLSVE